MISKTIKGGRDTWLTEGRPNSTHGGDDYLRLSANSGATNYAYWNPGWRPPAGTVILSATLRYYARGSSTGTRTITARRIAKSWKANTVTWNTRPAALSATATTSVGALSDRDAIEIDVTSFLQTIANGAAFYGFRLQTSGTTQHMVYGVDAGQFVPRLIVSYAFKPKAPTGLTTGGAVSLAKPWLQFDYNAMRGKVKLAAVQVRIDPGQSTSAPAFDTGEWATVEPELNLADTTYPGLASGDTTFWQLRYKSADGIWSPWSPWVSLTRTPKGVLTIDAPGTDPNDIVTEPTPPILWTFTGQTSYQVLITPAGNRSQVLHNTGQRAGSDQSWTPPSGVIRTAGARYSVRVRVWDNTGRVATPGDPAYVQLWRNFTYTPDATPDPVAALVASQPTGFPRTRLTWTRATPPDRYSIQRDGDIIANNLDPSDLLTGGTSYAWEDWTAAPWATHSYKVVPVVNGKAASRGDAVTIALRAPGVWVGDPRTGRYFNVVGREPGGPDISGLEYGEDAEESAKFAEVVRKISSMRGLEGSIGGGVLATTEFDPRPLATQLDDVFAIKGVGARVYRVTLADLNIPAIVGRISPAPTSEFLPGVGEERAIGLSIWQKGELPFRPVGGA